MVVYDLWNLTITTIKSSLFRSVAVVTENAFSHSESLLANSCEISYNGDMIGKETGIQVLKCLA